MHTYTHTFDSGCKQGHALNPCMCLDRSVCVNVCSNVCSNVCIMCIDRSVYTCIDTHTHVDSGCKQGHALNPCMCIDRSVYVTTTHYYYIHYYSLLLLITTTSSSNK